MTLRMPLNSLSSSPPPAATSAGPVLSRSSSNSPSNNSTSSSASLSNIVTTSAAAVPPASTSASSASASASPLVPSFSLSCFRRSAGSLRRSGSNGTSQHDFLGSDHPGKSSSMYTPLTVRSQQSGAGAGEPAKADGSFASSFTADDILQWLPMRSRSSMETYKQASQGRKLVTEADRARAASDYLKYEAPASLAANPPWQISFPHVCIATVASVLFGYHLGVVNIPLATIAYDLGFAGNTIAQGSVVSSCLVGAFFGSSICGLVADKYGRRRSFQMSTVPMLLGSVLSATAPSLFIMLVGRFFVGIGLGVAGPVTSLYVSEIAPTNVRGTLGSLTQVATCIGILGAILAGLPVHSFPGWWRVCFWISTIPAGFLACAMEYCAESPRWLFKQSQWLEAEHELERLWGKDHAKGAMADLVRGDDDLGEAPWSALLDRKYFKVVCLGASLFAFQQLAGINAVFYFSSVVFRNAGVQSDVAASVCMGIVNLAASLVAATLMDKKGRKTLMVWSFGGMGVAMALQAAAAGLRVLAPVQGPVSLCATLSFVFMFAIGAGPVPALLLPEIFSSRIRAKALSVALCVHWVLNFIVGLFFLQLLQQLGPSKLYCFFSAVCLTAAVFVTRNVQETKGKSLEEIETLLLADL